VKLVLCAVFTLHLLCPRSLKAQSQEVEQLLLNVEKLSQFKKILKDMYKGYEIVSKGYRSIKDIAEGNFSLHKEFLDGLLKVSPAVQRYAKTGAIISCQLAILKQGKVALAQFKADGKFTPAELLYIGNVYTNLFRRSLHNLDDLAMILTSGTLRMNDAGRLKAVDSIFEQVQEQYRFLKQFTTTTGMLSHQRSAETSQGLRLQNIYGLK
jgi:hypothetical protein